MYYYLQAANLYNIHVMNISSSENLLILKLRVMILAFIFKTKSTGSFIKTTIKKQFYNALSPLQKRPGNIYFRPAGICSISDSQELFKIQRCLLLIA